ncbi:MAG: YfiR family protein [Gammaproteobacteria bacterium]|nr:YfiR family protein [Gammaproteobacteria bacterium]
MSMKQPSVLSRRRHINTLLCGLLLFCLPLAAACAAQPQIKEYQVKARYLNGFINFITWPEGSFASPDSKLRLCVAGENPFGHALDIIVRKHNKRKTRNSNPQEVKYLRRMEEPGGCHLLYISDSEESYLNLILSHVKGKAVLTVSDLDRFATSGGMIQFYLHNNKVRFIISPQTLRAAGLEPNANLLRAADIAK